MLFQQLFARFLPDSGGGFFVQRDNFRSRFQFFQIFSPRLHQFHPLIPAVATVIDRAGRYVVVIQLQFDHGLFEAAHIPAADALHFSGSGHMVTMDDFGLPGVLDNCEEVAGR